MAAALSGRLAGAVPGLTSFVRPLALACSRRRAALPGLFSGLLLVLAALLELLRAPPADCGRCCLEYVALAATSRCTLTAFLGEPWACNLPLLLGPALCGLPLFHELLVPALDEDLYSTLSALPFFPLMCFVIVFA